MKVVRVRVYHEYYGCDTGCCGHSFVLHTDDGKDIVGHFEFCHPGTEDRLTFAKDLIIGQLKAEGQEECLKSIDWSTVHIDVSTVSDD